MVNLFFSAFNHVIKTLSRPLITNLKSYKTAYLLKNKNSKSLNYIINLFTKLGNFSNKLSLKLNSIVFNQKASDKNLLSQDKALEKGIEVFSEALIYTILLGIPIIEYYKTSKENKEKEKKKEENLKYLKNHIYVLNNRNLELRNKINLLIGEINSSIESAKNT